MKQIRRIPPPANWQALRHHELSSLVEFGAGIDVDQLAAHMRTNGYDEDEPIILLDGQIFDGRHRRKAAVEADVTPTFAEFVGADPLAYVTKKILRQHLNESQRAMLAARLADLPRGRPRAEKAQVCAFSQGQAAELLNVSERSVQNAAKVQEHGTPKLQAAVTGGTVSVSDAARVATEPPKVQNKAVAEVKAGRAATASQAVELICDRCRRFGVPVRDCEACARLKAKPAAPAPKPAPAPKLPEPIKPTDRITTTEHALASAEKTLRECDEEEGCHLSKGQADALRTELDRLRRNQKPAARPGVFVPPEVADVAAYCRERGNKVDAQAFVDFYQSKGWKVGKVPMKDWQAAVRTWERNEYGTNGHAKKTLMEELNENFGAFIAEGGE